MCAAHGGDTTCEQDIGAHMVEGLALRFPGVAAGEGCAAQGRALGEALCHTLHLLAQLCTQAQHAPSATAWPRKAWISCGVCASLHHMCTCWSSHEHEAQGPCAHVHAEAEIATSRRVLRQSLMQAPQTGVAKAGWSNSTVSFQGPFSARANRCASSHLLWA